MTSSGKMPAPDQGARLPPGRDDGEMHSKISVGANIGAQRNVVTESPSSSGGIGYAPESTGLKNEAHLTSSQLARQRSGSNELGPSVGGEQNMQNTKSPDAEASISSRDDSEPQRSSSSLTSGNPSDGANGTEPKSSDSPARMVKVAEQEAKPPTDADDSVTGPEPKNRKVNQSKSVPTAKANGGKKRYPCPFPGCDKTFSTSGHSSRHSRIHTGEKPYRCSYPGCNAQFSRYDNSLQHYRTHIVSSKGGRKSRSSKSKSGQSSTPSAGSGSSKSVSVPPVVPADPSVLPQTYADGGAVQPVASVNDLHTSSAMAPAVAAARGNGGTTPPEALNGGSQTPVYDPASTSWSAAAPRPDVPPIRYADPSPATPASPVQRLRPVMPYTADVMSRSGAMRDARAMPPTRDTANLLSSTNAFAPHMAEHQLQPHDPQVQAANVRMRLTSDPGTRTSSLGRQYPYYPDRASYTNLVPMDERPAPDSTSRIPPAQMAGLPPYRPSLVEQTDDSVPGGNGSSPVSASTPTQMLEHASTFSTPNSRPWQHRICKSGSMPSLLSFDVSTAESSHSLSKYSLSSTGPGISSKAPNVGDTAPPRLPDRSKGLPYGAFGQEMQTPLEHGELAEAVAGKKPEHSTAPTLPPLSKIA